MQFYDHLGIVTIFIIIRFSAKDVLISGMRSRRQKSLSYVGVCGQHHMHFSLASEIPVMWKKKNTKKPKTKPTSLQFLKITQLKKKQNNNQFPLTSSQLVSSSQHV